MSDGATQLRFDTYDDPDRDGGDARQPAPETADQRPRPENVPALDADCCWHCHNTVSQMHVLTCQSCGTTVRGPAIQDHPACEQCGGQMECQRYTWRLVAPADRDGDATGFGKRCYHPVTGEQKRAATLREEGFK